LKNKPTLHSHTHLQAAQVTAQTKACKRVCLSNRTTDRQSDDRNNRVGKGESHP